MRRNRSMNKTRSVALGLLLVMIIMMSGTFAFVQLRQAALNPGRVAMFAGARIHDVFELRDGGAGRDRAGEWNKNVFAENFGGTEIGVRVRFSEFLSLNDEPIIDGMDLNDISTWIRYLASDEDVHERIGDSALIGEAEVEMSFGTETPKIFMPTHNHVSRGNLPRDPEFFATGAFNNTIWDDALIYQFAETSGRAIDATAGTFMAGLIADDFESVLNILDWQQEVVIDWSTAVPGVTGFTPAQFRGQTGAPGHTGERDFWNLGQARVAPRFFIDEEANPPHISVDMGPDGLGVAHTAQATMIPTTEIEFEYETFEINGIMTMTQWLDWDMPDGNFWIYDNTCIYESSDDEYEEDVCRYRGGWFYWNGLVPSAQATSLLLETVTLPVHPNLEHVIHLESDFFVVSEIGHNPALDDMTDDAILIFMGETLRIDPDTFFRTLSYGRGVTPDSSSIVYTFEPFLRHYRGSRFLGLVPAEFSVTIAGGGPSEVMLPLVPPAPVPESEIYLMVHAEEEREVLTISIVDDRAINSPFHVFVNTYHDDEIVIDLPNNPGDLWVDNNGVQWRVLVPEDDEFGGIGNALLITEHVHGWSNGMMTAFDRAWNHGSQLFVTFEESTLRQRGLNDWFGIYASSNLQAAARGFEYQYGSNGIESKLWDDATNTPIWGVMNAPHPTDPSILYARDLNESRALTLPAGEIGQGVPFILSVSEVNAFIPNATGSGLSREATRHDSRLDYRVWWLRSPGSDAQLGTNSWGRMRAINQNGIVSSASTNNPEAGFRPALWVSPAVPVSASTPVTP